MQYLVLGANGYIGSYIYQRLRKEGQNVIGTGRRPNAKNDLLFFDIQKNTIDNILNNVNESEKTAIVCIAEANIDRCCEEYNEAYRINVIETKAMIHSLAERDFQIIYFSSDNVFDGTEGNYTEESPVNAINKYGMMKAEMEQYLLENVPQACILRISKVVSDARSNQNIFTQWERQIDAGKIRCICGNKLSFVYAGDIYQACLLTAENKLSGLYNIVGDRAYSRAELARKFYKKIGVDKMEICECDIRDFSFKDKRPLNLSMSNQKFRDEMSFYFVDMDSAIEMYVEKYEI